MNDQRGRPTFVDDLAKGTIDAVARDATGSLHLTNQGETATWFDLAQQIAELAGHDPRSVVAVSSHQLGRPAQRPANSSLESVRSESLHIDSLPHYEERLPAVIRAATENPAREPRGSTP